MKHMYLLGSFLTSTASRLAVKSFWRKGIQCTYCISMPPSVLARFIKNALPHSISQLDAPSNWRPGGRGFNPRRGRQHSFMEIDHEILSTVILSLPLIQEGQLSVSGERMCTILVNRLEDYKPPQ